MLTQRVCDGAATATVTALHVSRPGPAQPAADVAPAAAEAAGMHFRVSQPKVQAADA